MKEITVLAFGAVADVVGKSCFAMNDVASTNELINALEKDFPELKNIRYTLAVNKQTITTPTSLEHNATVALLPPFSGG